MVLLLKILDVYKICNNMKELDISHLEKEIEAGISINTSNSIIVVGCAELGKTILAETIALHLDRGIEIVVIDDKTKRRPNPFEAEPLIIKSIPRLEFQTTRPRMPKPYNKYQKNRNR